MGIPLTAPASCALLRRAVVGAVALGAHVTLADTAEAGSGGRWGPPRQVREQRKLVGERPERLLRWPAVLPVDVEGVRRGGPAAPGEQAQQIKVAERVLRA